MAVDPKNIRSNGSHVLSANSHESEIQTGKILSKALFHWPLYLLVGILAIMAAFLYLRYTKPVYFSLAKIYIKDDNKSGGSRSGSGLDPFGMLGGNKVVENEMEIIKSPVILEDVIRDKGFNIRYFEKGQLSQFEVYDKRPLEIIIHSDSSKVGNYFFDVTRKGNSELEVSFFDRVAREQKVIRTRYNTVFTAGKDLFSFVYHPKFNEKNIQGFQVRVDSIQEMAYVKSAELKTALLNPKSSVFVMMYEDVIAQRSADFLNAVAQKYNEYTLDDKNLTALNSIKFIDSRLQSLGSELGNIERDVEAFKSSRGITQLDESSRLYLDQARQADQKLDEANIQLSVYDQIERYINSNGGGTFTPVIGNVDAALTNLINRYQELLSQKKRLSLSLQGENPILQNVDQQIGEVKGTISRYIQGYRQNALTTKRGFERKVSEIDQVIARVPRYEREFINLQRQQSVKNQLYLFLLQKREETSISYASNIVPNKVIAPAYIPVKPIRPNKAVVMIVFVMGGIILTSLYLILKYMSNKRISSKRDIEKILDVPVLAEVFKEDHNEGKNFFDTNPRSVLKEQMLSLRSNLKFMLAKVGRTPIVLFTSSISGEGKTFLTAHLGKMMTGNDKKVILLEMDLRKPKLAKSLGVSNQSGLTNYLAGMETIDDIIKKVPGAPNLFIIPSGPIPPNPIELIESEKMQDLFEKLRGLFDLIIVDTAPYGLVSDAKSLSTHADCALYVVRFGYTPKNKLSEVADHLATASFRRMGVIFNGIEQDSSYGFYNYGYSSYGYGYGYFGEEKSKLSQFVRQLRHRMV